MTTAAHDLPAGLARAAGVDLARYRVEHLAERTRRALAREGVPDVQALVGLLAADGRARERFPRSLTVSVSGLFRDPAQFELLERELLPDLLARGPRLSVWSAGCADGSELASVAIVLERLEALEHADLLGSDLLDENVAVARRGAAVPARIRTQLRFERRDLLRDGAPPGRWRLVLCRNVGIYLAPAAKGALHELLAGSLAPGGVLMLRRSERLSEPRRLGLVPAGPHAYRKAAA